MKRDNYKLFLVYCKYLPYILAIYEITSSHGILDSVSDVLMMLFLYICSFAFNYCYWHRIPIYYIFIANIFPSYSYLILLIVLIYFLYDRVFNKTVALAMY
jgi:hypothetical protein